MSPLIDITLLRQNRDFRLLYFGQFISFIGTTITGVALPYQIYKLTQSTLMVGLLSLVQLIPLLITALIGGVLADRWNRRLLLIVSECLLSLGCIGLIINAQAGTQASILFIFIIAGFMSAITGFHRPAFDSIAQQIVAPEHYKNLGALSAFKYSFCLISGPALAGVLIAHLGLVATYLIDLITFLFSIVAILSMTNIPKPVVSTSPSILDSLRDGIRFAGSRQELIGSYLVDFLAMVFAMPNALFPAIAQNMGGAQTLGLLYSAPAVGSLFISFFSGWTSKITHDGRAIAVASMFWGLSMLFFGLTHSLWVMLTLLALSGAFDAVSAIFRLTLWNSTIPTHYRGRLSGIEMISYLSGPKLGDTRAGFIAASLGMPFALISGGVLCIVSVAWCCYKLPLFWNYQTHTRH